MNLEKRIQDIGKKLIATDQSANNSTEKENWLDKLVNQAITDPQFRIQTLRFIDVLPSLKDDIALTHHLQEYFGKQSSALPEFARWGLNQTDQPWLAHVAAPLVRYTIRGLSRRFMGGSQINMASATVDRLRRSGMNSSLDILGEACISEKEADDYQNAYLKMIPAMSAHMQQWQSAPIDQLYGRIIPRLNVSLKLSSLFSQIDPVNFKGSIEAIKQRLIPILECAREHKAFIMLDMEQYDFKHIIMRCFIDILRDTAFSDWQDIGIAIQAYLKDSFEDLSLLIEVLEKRKCPATIRLVRGAYWDYETIIAEQNNWLSPVWRHKAETDANYERCLDLLLSHHPHVDTAIATHNTRSIATAMAVAEKYQLSSQDYEFQMLYGMADSLKNALLQHKQPLRVYVPYGETLPGMAYLVRRLLENSSGQSILDSGFASTHNIDLTRPDLQHEPVIQKSAEIDKQFRNQSLYRFTQASESEAFVSALLQCRKQLDKYYPIIIDGKSHNTDQTLTSVNPANPDETIGTVFAANQKLADTALVAAKKAHMHWRRQSVTERADYLRSIANLLQQRRLEFAAWQILEAGKNWREADADVCEAIDFLFYYADMAEQMSRHNNLHVAGESNTIHYRSRGIGLVIPPWNFPLAILTGMLSATIVCGNVAILKPSSQTPVIAAKFVELIHQAGVPNGVVNLLPGRGSEIGNYLANHPDIHLIAFTGSRSVGSQLIDIAAQLQPGQSQFKRIIAEMGGKNAIIIDEDADMDEAVAGTVRSAFGYQGQKCSAASRAIVLDSVYDTFLDRLIETSSSLQMGSPELPDNFMGPVISKSAYRNILSFIDKSKQVAQLVFQDVRQTHSDNASNGYYIPPAIFTDVPIQSDLAQQEIFGPVLSVFRVADFDQALQLANQSRYALTGGVYSREPDHLMQAKQEFNVGNLYLNRKITGALVSRQPFGGFKMSGIGYKAGGENYLLQFMDSTTITENTMRRGFAPEQK